MNKMKYAIVALAAISAVSFAAGPTGNISNVSSAVSGLCSQLVTLLPVISMLMIIGAGVVYAAGQIMGAETRARAATWATAMLIGAVIGIVIVTVAPAILQAMYNPSGTGTTTGFACSPNW